MVYKFKVSLKRTSDKMFVDWTSLNGDLLLKPIEMLRWIKLQPGINVSHFALMELTVLQIGWGSTDSMITKEDVITHHWLPYKSKLGNPVNWNICIHRAFNFGGVSSSNAILLVRGGKIVTKNYIVFNLHAKKSGLSRRYSSSLLNTATTKYHINNAQHIFNITNQIKDTLKKRLWLDDLLKKSIGDIILNIQQDIARETFNKKLDDKNAGIKLINKWAHKLILHVYVVEELVKRRGSKTAGIDGKNLTVSSSPENKIELVKQLKSWKNIKPQPVRRVWISKNKFEKRPLGIPSIFDRCVQLMWVILLDPVIENKSDAHSFGFRKGRNAAQAIGHIQKNLQFISDDNMYIWDADIKSCFSSIDHDWIFHNAPIPTTWRGILWGWLKCGSVGISADEVSSYFEEGYSGIPQGGILSPLLMNVVLNGLEELMTNTIVDTSKRSKNFIMRKRKTGIITLGIKYRVIENEVIKYRDKNVGFFFCRYADDFVIGCASIRILKEIQKNVIGFLRVRGLVINKLKSKTMQFKEKMSFDFLGYSFIRLKYSPYKRVKYLQFKIQEYRLNGRARLYIYPSEQSFKNICRKFKLLIRYNYALTSYQLINKINPLIQGWCNYFCLCNSSGTRDSLRFRMWLDLKKWVIRKHPKASRRWLMERYFLIADASQHHELNDTTAQAIQNKLQWHNLDRWTFYGLAFKNSRGQQYKVPKINWAHFPNKKIKTLVASSFVPAMSLLKSNFYLNIDKWQTERNKRNKIRIDNTLWEKLYKRDKGQCYFCNLYLQDEQQDCPEIEMHHIIPWAKTQDSTISNLVLAHKSCHKAYHQQNPVKPTLKKILFSQNRCLLKNNEAK